MPRSKKEFMGEKDCPQCGSKMEYMEFTPKKATGKVYQGGAGHGPALGQKASGAKKAWWQCPESFDHSIDIS